jgi:hypothetical protein
MSNRKKVLLMLVVFLLATLLSIMGYHHFWGSPAELDCIVYFLSGLLFGSGLVIILKVLRD